MWYSNWTPYPRRCCSKRKRKSIFCVWPRITLTRNSFFFHCTLHSRALSPLFFFQLSNKEKTGCSYFIVMCSPYFPTWFYFHIHCIDITLYVIQFTEKERKSESANIDLTSNTVLLASHSELFSKNNKEAFKEKHSSISTIAEHAYKRNALLAYAVHDSFSVSH